MSIFLNVFVLVLDFKNRWCLLILIFLVYWINDDNMLVMLEFDLMWLSIFVWFIFLFFGFMYLFIVKLLLVILEVKMFGNGGFII